MPKVSIIVPMHDSVDFLAECLASIEMQTLDDIEILCIDDASEDATAELCAIFAKSNPHIRIVSFPENRGVAAARNEGIERATGDYIAFMDDDDWYPEPTTLEKLYLAAVGHDAPICGGSFSEYDNRTGWVTDDYRGQGHLSCFTFERAGRVEYRDWQGDFGFQRFLFKRSLLQEGGVGFPPLRRHEDPVFLVKAMVAAGWFYAIPDVVYRYRYHHKPRMLADESIDEAVEAIAEVLAICAENGYDVLRGYQVELLKVYAADYFGLVFNEGAILHRRAEAIRRVTATRGFREVADLIGSARAEAAELLRRYREEAD